MTKRFQLFLMLEVDGDNTPGNFDQPEDFYVAAAELLVQTMPHYNPALKLLGFFSDGNSESSYSKELTVGICQQVQERLRNRGAAIA